jgi:hypothetical protein
MAAIQQAIDSKLANAINSKCTGGRATIAALLNPEFVLQAVDE